jgi:hypothetical protein
MWLKHILEAIVAQGKLIDQAKNPGKASNNWAHKATWKADRG